MQTKRAQQDTKQMTARDRAFEYAKNVPPPKVRPPPSISGYDQQTELDRIKEEEFDEMGNTIGMEQTNMPNQMHILDAKNRMYADELEKIKQMFE